MLFKEIPNELGGIDAHGRLAGRLRPSGIGVSAGPGVTAVFDDERQNLATALILGIEQPRYRKSVIEWRRFVSCRYRGFRATINRYPEGDAVWSREDALAVIEMSFEWHRMAPN